MNSRVVETSEAPAFPTVLSQGRVVGNLLFISGQVSMKADRREVHGADIREQTRQTLENVKNICLSAGTSMDRIVKTTIFLTDMRHYAAMNEVYKEHFKQPMPTRSCVCVNALAQPTMLIEIEAVAELPM